MNQEISNIIEEYTNEHNKILNKYEDKIKILEEVIKHIKCQQKTEQKKFINKITEDTNTLTKLLAYNRFIYENINEDILGKDPYYWLDEIIKTKKIHYDDVIKMYQENVSDELDTEIIRFYTRSMFEQIDGLKSTKLKLEKYKIILSIQYFSKNNPLNYSYCIYNEIVKLVKKENDIELCKKILKNLASSKSITKLATEDLSKLTNMLLDKGYYINILNILRDRDMSYNNILLYAQTLFKKIKKLNSSLNMYEYEQKYEIVYVLANLIQYKYKEYEKQNIYFCWRSYILLHNKLQKYYNQKKSSLLGICTRFTKDHKVDISQLSRDIKEKVNNLECYKKIDSITICL